MKGKRGINRNKTTHPVVENRLIHPKKFLVDEIESQLSQHFTFEVLKLFYTTNNKPRKSAQFHQCYRTQRNLTFSFSFLSLAIYLF